MEHEYILWLEVDYLYYRCECGLYKRTTNEGKVVFYYIPGIPNDKNIEYSHNEMIMQQVMK